MVWINCQLKVAVVMQITSALSYITVMWNATSVALCNSENDTFFSQSIRLI